LYPVLPLPPIPFGDPEPSSTKLLIGSNPQ
jgi:hypothetical protein